MLADSIFQKLVYFSKPFFKDNSSVIVAVSGGSDSVALLFLLDELKKEFGIAKLMVCHINHGLRGVDSDSDELLVRKHAETLKLPFYLKKLEGHSRGNQGIENWARQERYRFFDELRGSTGCKLVATGHTRDDQAETVIMRIIRGAGLNGLRGIVSFRDDGVVRPLLMHKKQELVDWLGSRKIDFRYDISNNDTHFLRNRVRHEILPSIVKVNPGAVDHFVALAIEAQSLWDDRQNEVALWIRNNYREHAGGFVVQKAGLASIHAAEAIRQLLVKHGSTPDRCHINHIVKSDGKNGKTLLLPDKWLCCIGRNLLHFEQSEPSFSYRFTIPGSCSIREEARQLQVTIEPSIPKNLNFGKDTIIISGDNSAQSFIYRTVNDDDIFIPFGRNNTVSVLAFLAKQGLKKSDRKHIGILTTDKNEPVWIPGIRFDDRFRVTASTKIIFKVQSSSIL